MDTAAPSRRAGTGRGRPLIPPNYVSLRDLQELRLREKEERRRREQEEEAAARRAKEEEERRRKAEEEEAAAARRAKEEEEERRRRQEEEEAAARRVRDAKAAAAAPRPEMKGSSSSRAPFRYNDRNRGGPHRPPPPPRGEGSVVNSGGTAVDSRGKKGPGGGADNGTLGGGGKAWSEGKGKASAGLIAGPAEPATVSSLGGKPEETRKGEEAIGCEGSTRLGMSSAPGKLPKADTASYRGSVRTNYMGNGRKGLDGRNTETAMTGVTHEAVEALPPQALDSENKGKNGSYNQSIGKASVSPPGEATEASPLQGVKSDKKWRKKKPSGGRQAGAAPSSDWPNGGGEKPRPDDEGSRGRRKGNGQGTIWEAKSEGLGGKQTEVEGKVYSHQPTGSGSNRRSDSGQGMTRKANEDFGEKQLVVEVKAQSHPAADSNICRRSNGDQEMNQEAKSEGFEDKQTVVEMGAATQLKPCNVRNSRGRRYSGAHSRANGTTRQHSSVWVPKAAAAPVRSEVGNIP